MPLRITALYYVGSLPFILGLLYFIADMSKSAFAYQHEAEASFSLALLYIWMKCWQAIFCSRVISFISGAPVLKWSFPEMLRLCVTQTAVQPLGFIVLPVAAVITLPLGYTYAFFQNVSLLGNGRGAGMKAVYHAAFGQAKLFPRQNHVVLLIMALFWSFAFLNVVLLMFMAPQLLKTFTGIETAFTMAGWGLLNTTFFAAALCITHLLVNPLIKIIYVLRCFHGESLHTGEDLRMDLKNMRPAANILALLIALFLCCRTISVDAAEPPVTPVKEAGLSVSDLDRSLNEVIVKKEYAWRLPREQMMPEKDRGPFAAFVEGVIGTLMDWMRTIKKWVITLLEWLDEHLFRHLKPSFGPADRAWSGSTQILLYSLVAVAACLLAVFILRAMRRRSAAIETSGETAPSGRDLSSDDIAADELPSDEWLSLARQMAEKGDLRLALRALYLGSLSHLARHGIVTIAKYKSNHDYEKELGRKAAGAADLISAFSHNIVIFESIWYGMHDITQETFMDFNEKHKRIMTLADRV